MFWDVLGTCFDGISSFTCNCQAGFTGRKCEENIDDCLSSSCGNGKQKTLFYYYCGLKLEFFFFFYDLNKKMLLD